MMELYNLTLAEVVNSIVEEQAEARGISKALARKLVINALCYNTVVAEIDSQIDYIVGEA